MSMRPVGLRLPPPMVPISRIVDRQEGLQPLAPLVDELPAMDQHERIEARGRDHVGADHGLAECGRRSEHAEVVRLECGDSCRLHVVQLPEE